MIDDPKLPSEAAEENEDQFASPTELAGTTEGAIAAEFAARDAIDARDGETIGTEDTLPLDGE